MAGDWSWSGSGTRQIIHSQIPTSSAVSAQINVKRTLDTSEKLLRCPLSNLYKDYLIIENELHLHAYNRHSNSNKMFVSYIRYPRNFEALKVMLQKLLVF